MAVKQWQRVANMSQSIPHWELLLRFGALHQEADRAQTLWRGLFFLPLYSPECVEGKFLELRLGGILGHSPCERCAGPTGVSILLSHRPHAQRRNTAPCRKPYPPAFESCCENLPIASSLPSCPMARRRLPRCGSIQTASTY